MIIRSSKFKVALNFFLLGGMWVSRGWQMGGKSVEIGFLKYGNP